MIQKSYRRKNIYSYVCSNTNIKLHNSHEKLKMHRNLADTVYSAANRVS